MNSREGKIRSSGEMLKLTTRQFGRACRSYLVKESHISHIGKVINSVFPQCVCMYRRCAHKLARLVASQKNHWSQIIARIIQKTINWCQIPGKNASQMYVATSNAWCKQQKLFHKVAHTSMAQCTKFKMVSFWASATMIETLRNPLDFRPLH